MGKEERKQAVIIESTLTNLIYIGKNHDCYAFYDTAMADKFVRKYKNVRVGRLRELTLPELRTVCYRAGASRVMIFDSNGKQECPLNEGDGGLYCADHRLTTVMARLKQKGNISDLYPLTQCSFLVPCKVKQGEEGPEIKYGIIRHRTDSEELMYLAFSSLDDYHVWSSDVPGWSPLRISYKKLRVLCGERGVALNIKSNRLFITHDLFEKIDANARRGGNP